MAKVTINEVANLQNESTALAAINGNFADIAAALEAQLQRTDPTPSSNTMGTTLDMNNQRILNLVAPVSAAEPARKADLDALRDELMALI